MLKPLTIGIVVGEASGDTLGAGLIRSLRQYFPDATFIGIAGPQMIAEGCQTLAVMEELSVMGVSEILHQLPRLLRLRRRITRYFLENPPDIFIGIDAPEFNLTLEVRLKKAGIKTVHYVSPSVWAWRKGRVKKIKKAVDLLLTLFPFENQFYEEHGVPVKSVGHPLADKISFEHSKQEARKALGLADAGQYIALLPGSRGQEIKLLAPLFIKAAEICRERKPDLQFILSAASDARYEQLSLLLEKNEMLRHAIHLSKGEAKTVIAASDVVLAASGTVTLEVLLVNRPLVVAYAMAPFTWWLAERLIDTPYCSLPNLLANRTLVPEFLQEKATPEALANAILEWLDHPERVAQLEQDYKAIHLQLKQNANEKAALAIKELLQ